MTVYLGFNEHLDSPLGAAAASVLTTDTRVRSHVRAGFRFTSAGTGNYDAPIGASLTEGWVSAYVTPHDSAVFGANIRTVNFIGMLAQNSVIFAGVRTTNGTNNYDFYNAADASLTPIGVAAGAGFKVDIHFKIHATTGYVYCYKDGVLVYSFTGNTATAGMTSIPTLRFTNTSGSTSTTGGQVALSEILVADQSTIGSKVISRAFTAAGAVNNWAGVVSDINAAASPDTSFMSETAPNDILTMTSASIPSLGATDTVAAVFLSARANYEPGSSVTRIAPVARRSGTNHIGTAQLLINTVAPYVWKYETDPSTGLAWTEAGVNDLQLGFQAQA